MAADDIVNIEAVLPQEEAPAPIAEPESANQVFIRILGYAQIEEDFVFSILHRLRIRSYVPPEKGLSGYDKFKADNKFYAAVVEIMMNPVHPTRDCLMSKNNENDGRAAWFKLIGHYDDEPIVDDSFVAENAYTKWINTKLTGVHHTFMFTAHCCHVRY